MLKSNDVIHKLVDRYDYGGAYDLLIEVNDEDTTAGKIINSCRYAINFDFKTAKYNLNDLDAEVDELKIIKIVKKNLDDLVKGEPGAIFSELLENIKIQIVNEEFIDFLGRVYRFKESLYKYILLESASEKSKIFFINEEASKKNILKILRKKYKIFNNNVIFAVSSYINKYQKTEYKYIKVDKILSSNKMNELIELRHNSIIGHGFTGVSIDDIYKIYGNPYNVIDDFKECLEILGINILNYKYAKINELLFHLIDELEEN